MNRTEFCNLLVQSKEISGIGISDICFAIKMLPTSVYRMEKGVNNFSIDNMFKYLDAIGFVITLTSNKFKDTFKLYSRQDFRVAFPKIRKLNGMSQRAAAQYIGTSHQSIQGIESKNLNTSIDKFLQCIYALGYEVKIEKINNKTL